MLRNKVLRKILRSKPRHICCKCSNKAVWKYIPADERSWQDKSRFYCEDHIGRGCSCNRKNMSDLNDEEEFTDEQGRLLPCCEYDYNEKGFVCE
jgi:hypothetical protein